MRDLSFLFPLAAADSSLRIAWVNQLRGMESRPDEIEVTFGINLSTMAGAVIASASAAANFGVTVHWTGTHKDTTA